MATLTGKQLELYRWIENFIQQHRYPPTVREMATGLGVNINAITSRLKVMIRKGCVKRDAGARAIRLDHA